MPRELAFPDRDRHVRRSGRDYLAPFLKLLPLGIAWPRKPDSVLVKTSRGLTNIWGFVDGRAADLLERESDPRKTLELLPDWERAWGLPDPCLPEAISIEDRRRMLVKIMTWLGGQSRQYFIDLMQWVGGYEITIKEFAPFMAGVSRVGDTRPGIQQIDAITGLPTGSIIPDPNANFRWYIGPPEMRFYWSVSPGFPRVTWFRASSGQAGVDPHVQIGLKEEVACILERWKPAHTDIVMDYSKLAAGGPMQGTP